VKDVGGEVAGISYVYYFELGSLKRVSFVFKK
jgi:hypothetical protein